MPLKLNVGLSKKIGQSDFGSLGASCHIEVELDPALLRDDLDSFHRHVSSAFNACRQAVADELGRHQQERVSHESNGGNGSRRTNGRQATASQVRAIHAIANQQHIDLSNELRNRFEVDRPDDLLIGQASELIDAIKPNSNNGGR